MNNPFIIAEIGINHNSDMNIAKRLIDMAKSCGCDAVKFQKRTIDTVYTKEFLDSPRDSPWGTTQREQKEGLEFGLEEYEEIDSYCHDKHIDWFASAWDIESQVFLKQFNLKYNKIASPMITNRELATMIAKEGKHTFISTGKATTRILDQVVDVFHSYGCPFTLMHSVNKYPCPDEDCNLEAIIELKQRYDCPVGFSNHNPSILPTNLAVSLGASAIEVHITLDRTMYGTDQPASFEEGSLRYVVRDAHRVMPIIRGRNDSPDSSS
tara:strand:- start:5121 stop:5921 length:801 start_codon:yes stop_codon:yes gene_type:complete